MTASESKVTRFYNQEDVQQILHLAIARHANDKEKEFSYEQLLEIAAELEIPPESLKLAERDWLSKQGEMQQRQAFNLYRQRRFKKRLGNYGIVNTVLTLVDLVGGGGLSWSLYILLFWGLGVAFDACNTYQTNTEEYEIAFQKWHRKHQIKETFNTVWNKFFIKA
ncbi:MAG: 2TM domain-containing protein [Tolypothrix sp. Co-bin9]|nr:2TM domain-containing protein [Tolypothrix sp. Co-bin9]